jgi:O-antigen/teichoic acid export membrane protein
MAALTDSLWVGIQLAATGVAVVAGRASPAALFLIWAVAGSLSGVVFGAVLRASPRISGCRQWLRDNRQLCVRLSTEFVLNYGSYYALSYGLVVVAGSDQLGRWRAAQALIGPISVLLLGGTTLGVPESVRVRDRKASLQKFAVALSAGLGLTALLGGALVYALLPAFGPRLFPETWATARPVVPMLTLFAVAVGASTGAVAALRAREQAGWIVRRRAASGVVGLVVGLTLASRSGAVGALMGLALSEAGFALAAWIQLRRILVAPAL